MSIINWILENYQAVITSAVGILTAALAIALLIPGDVPDKQLQWLVDLLKKFSRK